MGFNALPGLDDEGSDTLGVEEPMRELRLASSMARGDDVGLVLEAFTFPEDCDIRSDLLPILTLDSSRGEELVLLGLFGSGGAVSSSS